jgi:hypothetical protein
MPAAIMVVDEIPVTAVGTVKAAGDTDRQLDQMADARK